LTLSEQQYFVWDTSSQSTKLQDGLEIWGWPWPPCPSWLRLFKTYLGVKGIIPRSQNHCRAVVVLKEAWVGHGPQIFDWPPAWPLSFVLNFTFKFVWSTYTADNFQASKILNDLKTFRRRF